MDGTGIGQGLEVIFRFAVVGVILIIVGLGYGGYKVYKWLSPTPVVIESHYRINPDIMLHTNGKTIDTIYIYKSK